MHRTGSLLRTAIVAVTAALTVTLVPHAAEARPHDPGDGAITAAQQEKNRKAAEVGRLTGLVAQADGEAGRAQDRAELAVEKYNKAVVDLDTATKKATAAKAAVTKSAKVVQAARDDFAKFARNSYMQGSTVGSSTTALLDADSPTDLLQRADLLGYAGKHKLDVMGQLQRANVRRANSESTARQLLAAQKAATDRAEKLKIEAAREVAAARAKQAALRTQKAQLNVQLEAARVRLNGLFAERARYRAWKKAQEEAAAREAARQKALRRRGRGPGGGRRGRGAASAHSSSGNSTGSGGASSAIAAAAGRSACPAGTAAAAGRRPGASGSPTSHCSGSARRTPGVAATPTARPGARVAPPASTAPGSRCGPGPRSASRCRTTPATSTTPGRGSRGRT